MMIGSPSQICSGWCDLFDFYFPSSYLALISNKNLTIMNKKLNRRWFLKSTSIGVLGRRIIWKQRPGNSYYGSEKWTLKKISLPHSRKDRHESARDRNGNFVFWKPCFDECGT